MDNWKWDTTLICLIVPWSSFYILNQTLFNYQDKKYLLGRFFSEFYIQKLGVFSTKYFFNWFFATEVGPRLVGYQKTWGLQVGHVSILCVFEIIIHLNPITHSLLIGMRFLRIILILIPGRRADFDKLTVLVDNTRNWYVAPLSLYTDLWIKRSQLQVHCTVRISPT